MMADTPVVHDPSASLPISTLNPSIFSDDLTLPDDYLSFDCEYFGITFDDENHPQHTEENFNSTFNLFDLSCSDLEFNDFVSDPETAVPESGKFSGNHGSDVSEFLNIPSPDNPGRVFVEETVKSARVLENCSSESRNENPVSSQSSGNCGYVGSEADMVCRLCDSGNSVVDLKVKRETGSSSVLKRKKESSGVNLESRRNESSTITENSDQISETYEEKKKARLIRNRESAQLSRQRKKQYVEELEEKVRTMQATIQDLNARISYITAENATLKQQMVAGGVCSPPVMYPPHPAMAPTGYPWTPFPPFVFKSHGSQVPLVPIPRLKSQQPASSQKFKKDVKKTEGTSHTKTKAKTKKVASISFLGLLLFVVLFGGLVPIMNLKSGGVTDGYHPGTFNDYKFHNQKHNGRVLIGNEHEHFNLTNYNASEPLVASLYVPRNDKLVKIDGSLIISSVLASEKAVEQQEMSKYDDTGLAVALDLVPAISIPTGVGHQRALPSNEKLQSKHTADGKPQQWFREGLSGLMLSSGMCTEVFQFDASAAIVPAVNITAAENHHNSTSITTVKNRRILHSLPIRLSDSITNEHVAGNDSKHKDHHSNNSVSSMVVSVLVDPREAGDGSDVDGGIMGGGGGGRGKSFSRIFVVVLLDSVKYVTYSCVLPLKGGSHLVKA